MSSKCPYCNKMVWFGVVRDKQLVHRKCIPSKKRKRKEPEPDILYLSPFPHYSSSFYGGYYRGRATPTSAEGIKEWVDKCEAMDEVETKGGKFRVIGFILERK